MPCWSHSAPDPTDLHSQPPCPHSGQDIFSFLIFGHQTSQSFWASDVGLSLVRVTASSLKDLIQARIQAGKWFTLLTGSCVLVAPWPLEVRSCLPRALAPLLGEGLDPSVSGPDSRSCGTVEGSLWDIECPGTWTNHAPFIPASS